MPLMLGLDEAGYGPLLGPFVCVGTLWRVPEAHVEADWWKVLGRAIARKPDRNDSRLCIGDSKKVYDREKGLSSLERPVLGMLSAAGHALPANVASLLTMLGADLPPASRCPWYADFTRTLPTDPSRSACVLAADKLKRALEKSGIELVGVRAMLWTEDAFNARVSATRNKHAVAVESVLKLIDWGGRLAEAGGLVVHGDRLGGRINYADLLMDAFPDRAMHVLSSTPELSLYRMASPTAGAWEVSFRAGAESVHLCVALASMFAKYVRELVMDAFNAYWQRLAPHVRPTAGYYNDAQRFLDEIRPILSNDTPPPEYFVRAR